MELQHKVSTKNGTSMLHNTTQLWGQVSDTIPELGTVLLLIVPNWLSSPLKPKAWLCHSGPELCHPGTKENERVSWQGSVMSSANKEIKFWCKNLDWDTLEPLLVQVDKENSIEFSFDYCILLIHILYLLLFIKSHASLLSYSFSHVHWLFN